MGNRHLFKVSDMVWQTLMTHPETRSDDRELILAIYEDYYGIVNEPFWQVMECKTLPSFESIRRARQKIQAEDKDLRAISEVEGIRLAKQEDYIAFARGEQI